MPLSVASGLTLPRSSRIWSVTVIMNHPAAGSGGDGTRAQLTVGMVNCGPDVVCANVVATPYVQSHSTMVPGAVEVLPLNVQLSVLPLFVNVQVSVWVGPLTPKIAVATVGL